MPPSSFDIHFSHCKFADCSCTNLPEGDDTALPPPSAPSKRIQHFIQSSPTWSVWIHEGLGTARWWRAFKITVSCISSRAAFGFRYARRLGGKKTSMWSFLHLTDTELVTFLGRGSSINLEKQVWLNSHRLPPASATPFFLICPTTRGNSERNGVPGKSLVTTTLNHSTILSMKNLRTTKAKLLLLYVFNLSLCCHWMVSRAFFSLLSLLRF